jgi:hypothetical protein
VFLGAEVRTAGHTLAVRGQGTRHLHMDPRAEDDLDHPGFLGGCDLWESWGS